MRDRASAFLHNATFANIFKYLYSFPSMKRSCDIHLLWRQEWSHDLEHGALVAHDIGVLVTKVEGQPFNCPRKVEYSL